MPKTSRLVDCNEKLEMILNTGAKPRTGQGAFTAQAHSIRLIAIDPEAKLDFVHKFFFVVAELLKDKKEIYYKDVKRHVKKWSQGC